MKGNFFERLLDNAYDIIWATDMEGKFIYINDSIKGWGYEKDELIGQPLLNFLNTKSMGKSYQETSETGVNKTMEMEIIDKRGAAHMVAVSSSPLTDDDGSVIGVMGIIHDISETQILQKKLESEERLASLGRLATGIAHEIRNPLSSVKMNLVILRNRLEPKGEDEEHFSIAQEEVAHLDTIVNELIDYAKPTPINLKRYSLVTPVDQAIYSARVQSAQRNIKVKKSIEHNTTLVLIDKGKIHQAVLNLLLNAIQASDPGSEVIIQSRVTNSRTPEARIEVVDNGKGITPEEKKFIFDPFFTTSKSGAGMGLSIVRSIMAQHNGSVQVESDPGRETRVSLVFPTG